MLNLSSKLTLSKATIESPNLTGAFSAADLDTLGSWCWEGYNKDKQSRSKWERRTESAMDLAMQIQKDKTFPWQGASNVAFPLITIAVMQFHSRAYPTIVQGNDVVKCRVIGPDPEKTKTARAERVSMHMSWQRLEEDKAWEEQQDRALINVPVVGTAFKKSYSDPSKGTVVSELVLARDLVLAYNAKSVEACPRKTHLIPLSRNDIHERVLRGTYRDVLEEGWYQSDPQAHQSTQDINKDNRQGVTPTQPDETSDFVGCEMHVDVDLDQDGYAEPYIITFERESKCILRIVTRFDREQDIDRVSRGTYQGKIIRVRPTEYFTKIPFVPSPDGGIYDVGFGCLLGPLNESANSLVNQIIDAGSLKNGRPIFLGRGAKIRGGVYSFAPFSMLRVDSTGDDLRKSLVEAPVGEPSAVLFQLLNFLVEYTNRISGATDMMVGENPGQNTPASTARTMISQGEKIYNAIYKRIWRSMKEEYKKIYQLNAIHLTEKKDFGDGAYVLPEDYHGNPDEIVPVADPHLTSEEAMLRQAQIIAERSATMPGYDRVRAEKSLLKLLHVTDIDQVFPGPDKTGPLPNPKLQLQEAKDKAKLQDRQMVLQAEQQQFVAELLETRKLNQAKIAELMAKAASEMAAADGVKEGHQIALMEAQLGLLKHHDQMLGQHIERMLTHMQESEANDINRERIQGMAGIAGNGGGSAMAPAAPASPT